MEKPVTTTWCASVYILKSLGKKYEFHAQTELVINRHETPGTLEKGFLIAMVRPHGETSHSYNNAIRHKFLNVRAFLLFLAWNAWVE